MRRQPFPQLVPCPPCQLGQPVQVRPGALRVHVVGGQWRHPAPVVRAGGHEQFQRRGVGQVRRHLDPHVRAQRDPGGGDGGGVLRQVRVRGVAHRRPGLGPEVLDDDLLDVPAFGVRLAQGRDRLGTVPYGLPDSHQHPGGERDALRACIPQYAQPHRRILVGRAEMRVAGLFEQSARGGLQHHPHRRGDGAQHPQFGGRHHPGVQVHQETRLGGDQAREMGHVRQCRREAVLIQPGSRLRPPALRTIAKRQQRLLAAERGALARDKQRLIGRHEQRPVSRTQLRRGVHEHAVVAAVAAERRDGDEHLPRVGDDPWSSGPREPLIPQRGRPLHEGGARVAARTEQRLDVVRRHGRRAVEHPLDRPRGRGRTGCAHPASLSPGGARRADPRSLPVCEDRPGASADGAGRLWAW